MHERVAIPHQTRQGKQAEYDQQLAIVKVLQSVCTRILARLHVLHPSRKWIFYRIAMGLIRGIFKVLHRTEVYGRENIPKGGAIFISNHIANSDVVMPFMAMFKQPVGVFTDMGTGFFVDIARQFGIVPRWGYAPYMIEDMIQKIWSQNKYFVMWPEGTPDKGHGIMQGFSGIVKVYATLNADKDRIPFVPVVMQESNPPIPWEVRKEMMLKKKLKKKKRRLFKTHPNHRRGGPPKIIFTFLKPVFIPRAWLAHPDQGGKTPRQIMDAVMLIIAKKRGQKILAPNPVLNDRKTTPGRSWH
jgi:1-acyl-sn-glycerol-3-phosphate acyltransferase